MNKTVLDVCCGARASWYQPDYPGAEFCDIRSESLTLCDGRTYTVNPDTVADFRHLPHASGQFDLVFFDPPHLLRAGQDSWLRAKYGVLDRETWKEDLQAGFTECFRVLRPGGTLVFKWCEDQVHLNEILPLAPCPPLFGAKRSKHTHFLIFYKPKPTMNKIQLKQEMIVTCNCTEGAAHSIGITPEEFLKQAHALHYTGTAHVDGKTYWTPSEVRAVRYHIKKASQRPMK